MLYGLRVARKVGGLYQQPEFANLETMLLAQQRQPHDDYRTLARVLPAGIAFFVAVFLPMAIKNAPWGLLWPIGFALVSALVWRLFDYLVRSIPNARRRIRMISEAVMNRMGKLTNVVGVEPAISPRVGEVLDEAAAIYLRYPPSTRRSPVPEPEMKARTAIEEAMARMMGLVEPETVSAQELELEKGWAAPLLKEMKDLSAALDEHASVREVDVVDDPLANLRAAKLELEARSSAVQELEQRL